MKATKERLIDPWRIAAEDFPADGTGREKLEFLLNYAVLAPSSRNSQPWQFHVGNDQVEIYADRTRACRVVDPGDRELIMSCGCALFHLRIAMQHFNCLGLINILPEPTDEDLIARVSLGTQGVSSIDQGLFQAIPRRRTNRQAFDDRPVPETVLSVLQWAAQKESAWLESASRPETKLAIAELVAEGDRLQWADKAFRQELAKWVHSAGHAARDGMPVYSFSAEDLMYYDGPFIVRTFELGDGQAAKDHEVATGSPALAVLGTDKDGPRDWIAAGQALAHVLLRARVEEVCVSFLNQPIEVPSLRPKLSATISKDGFPQTLLRLGFGDQVKPTPRRPIEEVLM